MSERPPLSGIGRIVGTREPGRLYQVEMPNGYHALAVVPREGPAAPASEMPEGLRVEVAFSPYDMSRCRIVHWSPTT